MILDLILRQFLVRLAVVLILGFLIYLLTRYHKIEYELWEFPKPKATALTALAAVFFSLLVTALIILLIGEYSTSIITPISKRIYTLKHCILMLITASISLIPIILFMKKGKESPKSAGLSKHNIKASSLIAIVVMIIPVTYWALTFENRHNLDSNALTSHLLFAFICYTLVGFWEEFMFRGYLQTRLSAWLGKYPGWIFASIIMAMIHIPFRIVWGGVSPTRAAIIALIILPTSFIYGYLMLRTGNVMGPAILHTFTNMIHL